MLSVSELTPGYPVDNGPAASRVPTTCTLHSIASHNTVRLWPADDRTLVDGGNVHSRGFPFAPAVFPYVSALSTNPKRLSIVKLSFITTKTLLKTDYLVQKGSTTARRCRKQTRRSLLFRLHSTPWTPLVL
jgi:hypothetical protein